LKIISFFIVGFYLIISSFMKNCNCFKKNFSTLIFLISVLISLQNSLFAQNKAAEGMKVEEINFSSFSSRPVRNLASWKRINQESYFSHPEFGVLPSDAPCSDCIEDLSKRSVDERYFIDNTDQNQYYQQKAMGQLHELVDGQWLTVDHRLKNSSNGVYLSGFQLDRAGFNVNEKSGFLETNLGKLSFNQWKLIVKKEGQLQPSIAADWSNFTIGEDGVKIYSVFPGIDAEMRVLRGAIKTNFIIRTNEFGIFDELIFSDEFDLAGGVKLSFTDGTSSEGVGDVFVKNDLGELAHVKQGILYAKNGPKDLFLDPIYRISGSNLGVVVPYNWINENIDEYELIVDPLVTGTNTLAQAAIAGSQYNASCNFTNSCNSTLTVQRPANATITNVTWSFNYQATGICWLEDGGVRFSTGGCVSPAGAGLYWFCPLIGNGTCTGTNVSIINDLGACLPAPSCAQVPVTFTMQFFRSCWGTSGCNNNCIGAASPWTMTISGRTLEYTNAASNLTVSATTVCQGGTITASTTASYGVPPYTYNWSFSSTGSPSIGSGANATITFPTSGAITLYSFVTDFCGNVVSSSRVITVTPSPTITATPNTPTICTGQSTGIALSSSAVNTTYIWTVVQNGVSGASNGNQTGNAVSINQTLSATGSIAGTATYTITPTAGGCSGTPITVVVTVNPTLTASVSAAASASTICDGSSITFTATPTNGGTAPTYQWYVNGTPIAGQTGATFTSTTLTNGATVTVQMTSNAAPCLVGSPATSNSIPITVTALLVPSVSITPSATVACAGASLTFTAVPTNGGTTPTYQWYVNGTAVAGQTNSAFTSTTLANGASVTVQMTSNATPCLSTPTATSSPIAVTINPPLTASVAISASTNTICSGNSVTFTATPTNGGTAPTYQWYVDGNPVAGQTNSTFTSTTLTNGATVTVQMTSNAAPCLLGSPATSNSIPITVTALLVPSVSITPSATVACAGASLTFTAVPTNGGTTPTYQWYVNGTAVAGQTNSTFTSTTLANGASVTVQMTSNATPCLLGSSATSNALSITVNPVLIPAVVALANTTTACAGASITFTATPTNGGTTPTYQWYVNGTAVAGQTNSTFTSTTLANGASVTVQMTSNATPCLSTPTATSSPIVVTINPPLTASVAISASTNTICSGNSVTFTATPTNGGTAPTYQWYVNGTPVAGQTNSTFTSTTLANAASVTVQMTSNATPCLVGSPATSNAVLITVNPVLIPSVAILANTTTACTGASITFTATPTNGGTAPTYQWFVDGNPVAGQTNSTFTSTTLANGASVTVQLTSNATPCLSTPTATSSPIVVTINPSISASVSISASTNTICSGNSVTFTASPTNGGTAPTYQWYVNGTPIAGQTNSTFTSTTLANAASVTVQMTSNATPCLIGSPTTSNAEIITVNPNPVVTATNNGPLCVTQQLELTATTIAGATYDWTGPQSFNSLSQNPIIPNVTLANAGNYTVTVNLNGCTSSATSTVTIVTGFPATINPSGPFCLNSGIVTLTASAGGGIWAGIGITNASNGSFNPSLGAVGINTISYTTPGACGGTSTIDILILPIPSISISSDVTSGCAPLEVTFNDNSTPTSSSVLWNFGNGVISSTLNTVTYNSPGCYDVSLTSTNAGGCSTTETFIDFICVLEDPVADFTTDEFSTSLYTPTFELVNQSDFSVSYLWEFDNNTTSTLTNPTVSYPEEPGSYTVQLVAYNAAGCTDTITKILTVRDELVFFVPNSFTPNGDEFNNAFVPIFTSGFDPFEFNLTIINRWGELIFESNDATVGWDGTYDGKIVPDGMYVWKIRMKNNENDKKYTYTGHVNVLK
jgi:gliding motility-associated-like protein